MIVYVAWFIFAILMMFFRFLPISPLLLTLALVFFLFLPGFSLARILRKNYDNFLDNLILYLALGLIFNFLIGFLAILVGLTLSTLFSLTISIIFALFVLAFLLDFFIYQDRPKITFIWQKIFSWENLPLLLLFLLAIWIIAKLTNPGSLMEGGDFLYHLSILRKVTENQALTVGNLSYVKNAPNIAYIFPIWHVFLGEMAKFFHGTDIFTLWQISVVPILVLVFLVWYWLGKKILPNKESAVLAVIFLVAFQAWIFNTLPIPHSLTQFLLLPLGVGLALKYIFDPSANFKDLIILSLFAVLMGVVHLTAYFYFLLIMVVFGLIYTLFNFKRAEFTLTIKKIALATFSSLIILLPLGLIIESRSKTVSSFLDAFGAVGNTPKPTYDNFGNFTLYGKLGYLFLPFTILFLRKHPKLYFLIAAFLVLPLAYWAPIKAILVRFLGFIFIDRLYAATVWGNFALAIFFVLILLLIDFALAKLNFNKIWAWFFNIFLGIIGIWLLIMGNNGKFSPINSWIFGQNFNSWLDKYHIFLIIIFLGLAIAVYIWQKNRPNLAEFFFAKIKNPFLSFIFILTITLIFIPINFSNIGQTFASSSQTFTSNPPTPAIKLWAYQYLGGYDVVNFINQNIPPRSVFYTYKGDLYFFLPTVANVQMPSYDSGAPTRFDGIYEIGRAHV